MAKGDNRRDGASKRRNGASSRRNGAAKRFSQSGRAGGREVKGHGALLIIGGREDKQGDKLILRDLCRRVGSGRLVVATVASTVPDEVWEEYESIFRGLGCKHVHHLNIRSREDALLERNIRILDHATAVFFTGGDQLKITSQLGDTPIYERLREIYEGGGTIAGTSAGASVMSETMMVSGNGSESHKIGGMLKMAPGFGFISGVLIDQHFAERGRIGRLLGAVAQNPRILGLGIDENTAILVERQEEFRVIGEGAIYVVDGRRVSFSNLTEEETDRTLAIFGVQLHLLSQGDTYDLDTRCPRHFVAEVVEEELKQAV